VVVLYCILRSSMVMAGFCGIEIGIVMGVGDLRKRL
jgi:hypothetical protein